MNELLYVKDVMTAEVQTVGISSTVILAVKKMNQFAIGSVVAVDPDKRAVGIITQSDILRRVVEPHQDPLRLKVRDIMSKPLHTIPENASVEEAAKTMTRLGLKRLLVTDGERHLGIVTTTDLVRSAPMIIELLQEFVRARFVPHRLRSDFAYHR